jgi:hypothetical protein
MVWDIKYLVRRDRGEKMSDDVTSSVNEVTRCKLGYWGIIRRLLYWKMVLEFGMNVYRWEVSRGLVPGRLACKVVRTKINWWEYKLNDWEKVRMCRCSKHKQYLGSGPYMRVQTSVPQSVKKEDKKEALEPLECLFFVLFFNSSRATRSQNKLLIKLRINWKFWTIGSALIDYWPRLLIKNQRWINVNDK